MNKLIPKNTWKTLKTLRDTAIILYQGLIPVTPEIMQQVIAEANEQLYPKNREAFEEEYDIFIKKLIAYIDTRGFAQIKRDVAQAQEVQELLALVNSQKDGDDWIGFRN